MSTHNPPLPSIYTRSLINSFRKSRLRIGILLPGFILPYAYATAVARLRVYDVIEIFAEHPNFVFELYQPWRRYDAVIFEKSFTLNALNLAQKLKSKGTRVILDVNVNYFSKETPRVTDSMHKFAHQFASTADAIITPSQHLTEELKHAKINSNIRYIPEPIPDRYFIQEKTKFNKTPELVWSGYHTKAQELEEISDVLKNVQAKYDVKVTLISDKDPQIDIPGYTFVRYREKTIVSELIKRDVFIAPRQFDMAYKYNHTFTKIGAPMAIGLPIIASPMPSYLKSPALICNNRDEWSCIFDKLYKGYIDLQDLSQKGRTYCRSEFSWKQVREYYTDLIASLFENHENIYSISNG